MAAVSIPSGPAGKSKIGSDPRPTLKHKRILIVDRAHHIDAGGNGRHQEAVSIFQRKVGDAAQGVAGWCESEDDATGGANLAKAGQKVLFAALGCDTAGRILGRVHRGGCQSHAAPLDLQAEGSHVFVDSGLLHCAGRLTGEFRAKKIRIGGQPSSTFHQMTKGFSRLRRIHARMGNFAVQLDLFGLVGDGDPEVCLREDRHHIAGLQFKILGRVVLQNQLAQIEGDDIGLERLFVQTLNDGVIPIDLRRKFSNLSSLRGSCDARC